jgi:seryl-tRNA synthetase
MSAVETLKEKGNQAKLAIAELEPKEKELRQQLEMMLLVLPNLPAESTPIGKSENDNVEVRRWGDQYKPTHEVLSHEQIGTKLGILNIERGVKVAQARFISLYGTGAALERALIQFMLNTHIAKGYVEVMPPFWLTPPR